MDDIAKWILPVYTGKDHYEGRSFIVGTYLITAAHVVIDLPSPYIWLENERYELKSENAIIVVHNPSADEDFAIFQLPLTDQSPLQLADVIPQRQEKLTCYYIRIKTDIQSSFFKYAEKLCILASIAKIIKIEEKAFLCHMDPMLAIGDSGTPLFDSNNNVVGMLVAGDDKSICAFQSASYIKNILISLMANRMPIGISINGVYQNL